MPTSAVSVAHKPVPSKAATSAKQAPLGLKGFLLRYDEPTRHVFASNPAFAWRPTANAAHYEFQLATSSSFRDNSVVYENDTLPSPAAIIPATLPWASAPVPGYFYWARVRAVTSTETTPWSTDFGFNLRWASLPTPVTPDLPGLLHWTPVVGADAYQVQEYHVGPPGAVERNKFVETTTNVLDERDWYTFHDATWYTTVRWRVRAIRIPAKNATVNQLPTGIFGPWSPLFTNTNPTLPTTASTLTPGSTVSDVTGSPNQPAIHGLMPGFTWAGNATALGDIADLYRVYVFSDPDCTNPVYVGALVGSPAYAPRLNGPLKIPSTTSELDSAALSLLEDGAEGAAFTAESLPVVASESLDTAKVTDIDPLAPANLAASVPTDDTPAVPDATSAVIDPSLIDAKTKWTDLWDLSFPARYYWAVVPVAAFIPVNTTGFKTTLRTEVDGFHLLVADKGVQVGDTILIGSGATQEADTVAAVVAGTRITLTVSLAFNHTPGDPVVVIAGSKSGIEWRETEVWQDACTAPAGMSSFGKTSQPVVTGGQRAFISGLGVNGTVQAAVDPTRAFFGAPVIAWQPALGASQYEVQWSQTAYPFVPVLDKMVTGENTLMQSPSGQRFKPGTYYYRVRGIDFQLPKSARGMGWSKVQKIAIAAPSYDVTP